MQAETTSVVRRIHRRRRAHKISRSRGGNFLMFLFLAAIGVVMALPLVYAVSNAVKPLEEFYLFPPRFFAIHPTVGNFLDLFELATSSWVPFSRYLFNSVFVSVVTTALYVLISGMCAYVLSKHAFFGKKTLNQIIVISMLFNSTIMTIPQYVILSELGMIDTFLVIIVPTLGSTMGVFLLKQTMDTFPDSILESARLEGCNEMQLCWRIVMPSIKPGWITVIIFIFQSVWNNTASTMIFTESNKVLPTMLTQLASGVMATGTIATGTASASAVARAGVSSAATLFVMIPPIVVFVLSQSQVLETMASSGIKE